MSAANAVSRSVPVFADAAAGLRAEGDACVAWQRRQPRTASAALRRYFPVIVCAEHDSPLDALVAMKLPRDEAQDLVVASWLRDSSEALLARIDGGRHVAALPLADGRWAAGNAYPELACPTPADAERRLARLLRGGRRGCIAWVDEPPP